jgi:LysM repeat protein
MAVVVIRLPGTRRPRTLGRPAPQTPVPQLARKRATIKLGTELLTLPMTSPEVRHFDVAAEWVQVGRSGQFPLMRKAGPRLRGMSFAVRFTASGRPVEGGLGLLDRFSNAEQPLAVAYGPFEAGLWRLVTVNIRSQKRQPGTNAIVEAEAELTFVEHVDDGYRKPPSARPTPAPATPRPGASAAPAPAKTAPKRASQVYVVQRGDTLSKIAARFYGDADRYPEIAKANKLRDPNLIRPGQKLVIP